MQKQIFNLEGRQALITGATGGIGGAIAMGLYNQGAKVILSGTNEQKLKDFSKTFAEDRITVLPCQLSDKDQTEALFEQAEEKAGPIDILVNAAGITKDTLLMRMKEEDWQSVVEVNLSAVFRLSRAAIKAMIKRRFGRIINITSIVGTMGNPGQANYCATKAAITGMSKSIAYEVATRGITVNCIAPGFISTAMTDVLTEGQKETIMNKIPLQRMGTPEEIGSAAVFLASEEASYITGQTIHVNGGMIMV